MGAASGPPHRAGVWSAAFDPRPFWLEIPFAKCRSGGIPAGPRTLSFAAVTRGGIPGQRVRGQPRTPTPFTRKYGTLFCTHNTHLPTSSPPSPGHTLPVSALGPSGSSGLGYFPPLSAPGAAHSGASKVGVVRQGRASERLEK